MRQDILIDTNVFLEVFLSRAELEPSRKLLNLVESNRDLSGWVAPHGLATTYYLFRQKVGSEEARQDLRALLDWLKVSPLTTEFSKRAFTYGMSDFEDALQAACAEIVEADLIVTWNTKDFTNSPIPAVTPSEFLDRIE